MSKLITTCRSGRPQESAGLVDAALTLLSKLAERDDAYRLINRQIGALQPEMPTRLNLIDEELFRPLFALLDTILGDEVASYFFCETRSMPTGGFIEEKDGTRFWIRSIEDVRSYVERSHTTMPSECADDHR